MKTVLAWDIDGTLLTTNRAGIFALEKAAFEVTGKKVDFSELKTAGATDIEVGVMVLKYCGLDPTEELNNRLVKLYEKYLPDSLNMKQGRALEGVIPILEHVENDPDIYLMLLTGNTQAGAKAKLDHYELSKFFVNKNSFSDNTKNRPEIAKNALNIVKEQFGDFDINCFYLIGDTPHDISCGKSINARTIAVASGGYSYENLKECKPWLLINELPTPEEFVEIIGIG